MLHAIVGRDGGGEDGLSGPSGCSSEGGSSSSFEAKSGVVPLARADPAEYWRRVRSIYAGSGAVILGNVLEWYDWTVFGYMESILKDVFMDGSDANTWLLFAVPFVARPVGSIVLGWVADRCGRKVALNAAIWGMALSTVLQGCLVPGLWGTKFWFVLLRLVSGLSAGGESAGVNTYMTEIGGPVRDHTLGAAVGVNNLSGALAFFLANAVTLGVSAAPKEVQLAWAWRVPFLLAAPIGVASVAMRRSMKETDAFESVQQARQSLAAAPDVGPDSQEDPEAAGADEAADREDAGSSEESTPTVARKTMSSDAFSQPCAWCEDMRATVLIVLVMGAVISCNYLPLYLTRWLETACGLDATTALALAAVSKAVQMFMTPLVAFCTDRHGCTFTMIVGGLATALTMLPFLLVLLHVAEPRDGTAALDGGAAAPTGAVLAAAFLQLGLALPALASFYLVPAPLYATSLFPDSRRGLGAGLGMGLASVMGGLTPMISTALANSAAWLPGAFITAICLPSVASLVWSRLAAKRRALAVYQRRWLF